MRRPAIRNLNSWEEGTQADLYTLTKEQLLALEGFADKKADNLLAALAAASADQLQMVEGIGPNIAAGIVDWFSRERNRKVLEKLKAASVWPVNRQSSIRWPAGGTDLRRHRHTGGIQPRGREGIHRNTRRQGDGFGQQKYQLSRAG